MQDDKIFNNTYGDGGYEGPLSFKIDPGFEDDTDQEDRIHYDMLMNKIDDAIKQSDFKDLSKVTPGGITKKLTKIQINQVFFYVVDKLGDDYTKVDIFGALSDYFDVFPNKFYTSLSNKYKDELIRELDAKYDILRKKNIRKLF